jgi:hypothetical protein
VSTVNSIPAYILSSGGSFAVFGSCMHSYSSQINGGSTTAVLASCGVKKNDIYIEDSLGHLVSLEFSRVAEKTISLAGNVAVAAFSKDNGSQNAITIASDSSHFDTGGAPALVRCLEELGSPSTAHTSIQRSCAELVGVGTLSVALPIKTSEPTFNERFEAKIVDSDVVEVRVKSIRKGSKPFSANPRQSSI